LGRRNRLTITINKYAHYSDDSSNDISNTANDTIDQSANQTTFVEISIVIVLELRCGRKDVSGIYIEVLKIPRLIKPVLALDTVGLEVMAGVMGYSRRRVRK
jgi:hypothetical protein